MTRPRYQTGSVEQLKGGEWKGHYRDYAGGEGKHATVNIGKAKNKTEARRRLRDWLDANINSPKSLSIIATLEQVWQMHSPRFRRSSPEHRATMESLWRVHLEPAFGDARVDQITHGEIEAFFDRLAKPQRKKGEVREAYSRATLRQLKLLLDQLFRLALSEGIIRTSPMLRANLRFSETRETPASPEIESIRAIRRQLGPLDDLIFCLCALLGLSKSELRPLRVDDVADGCLRIDEDCVGGRIGPTKTTRRKALIPCPAVLYRDLEARAKVAAKGRNGSRNWLFPALKGGGPFDADRWLVEVLRPAAVRAKVTEHIDFRALRRTFVTICTKVEDLGAAARIARNSRKIAGEHYLKAARAATERAVEAVYEEGSIQ